MSEAAQILSLAQAPAAPDVPETAVSPFAEAEAELLTQAEREMAAAFSEKIDLHNADIIMRYGAAAQKKVAAFSDGALAGVRSRDLGQIGEMIRSLVDRLRDDMPGAEEAGGRLFRRTERRAVRRQARYDEALHDVEKIAVALEQHQNQLLTDFVLLGKMHEANQTHYRELTMYILAGRQALQRARETTLPQLVRQAEQSGLMPEVQAAADFAAQCDRFEKKLYDLELTRTMTLQMASQLRLVRDNNTLMSEKLQTVLNSTIPLWKNQMALSLGMAHAGQAMQTQREVSAVTNELLEQRAAALKAGSVQLQAESRRGVADLETLARTSEQLIETLDEVLGIQQAGREARSRVEAELQQAEETLKQNLQLNTR